MKILILDNLNNCRDLSQMDMYSAMADDHELIFNDYSSEYDVIYLGIYHQLFDLSEINGTKKPIIIDQADNEEFILMSQNRYKSFRNKILLSRYLPNEKIASYCILNRLKVRQLGWYIDPSRVKKPIKKTIDVSCMMSINTDRRKLINEFITLICKKNGLSFVCGDEYWTQSYYDNLNRSKLSIVECNRSCLTQKYIESAIADCYMIGDVPLYPENKIIVEPFDFTEKQILNAIDKKQVHSLYEYTDRENFKKNINKILDEIVLV